VQPPLDMSKSQLGGKHTPPLGSELAAPSVMSERIRFVSASSATTGQARPESSHASIRRNRSILSDSDSDDDLVDIEMESGDSGIPAKEAHFPKGGMQVYQSIPASQPSRQEESSEDQSQSIVPAGSLKQANIPKSSTVSNMADFRRRRALLR